MVRLLLGLLLLLALPGDGDTRGFGRGQGVYVQTISSVVYSGPTTFVGGAGSANKSLGPVSVTMNQTLPVFSGTCSLSGANAASFAINANTCALSVGATDIAGGSYNINIVASQANIINTGVSIPVAFTVNAAGQWFAVAATSCLGATPATTVSCPVTPSYKGDLLIVMPGGCASSSCAIGSFTIPAISSVTISNNAATCVSLAGTGGPASGDIFSSMWACNNLSGPADTVNVTAASPAGALNVIVVELYGQATTAVAEQGNGSRSDVPASNPSIALAGATTVANDLILSLFASADVAGVSSVGACCTNIPYTGSQGGGLLEYQVGATLNTYTNSWVYAPGSGRITQSIAALKQSSLPLVASPGTISPTTFSVMTTAAAGAVVGTVTATTSAGYFFTGLMSLATNPGGYLTLTQSNANPSSNPNQGVLAVKSGVTLTPGTYPGVIGLTENGSTVNQNFTLTVAAPTITSVNCNGCASTFTSGVPNGVIGNVTVTMSSGLFTGTLSLGGTDASQFQLSGTGSGSNLIQSASGTPGGTYTHLNIIATMASAGNSPQQISPTLVGSSGVACDFGTTAPSIPAQANRAGFTTCGFYVDFRTVNAASWVSSNVFPCGAPASNWPTTASFVWAYFLQPSAAPPCSELTVSADPVFSSNALDIKYLVADRQAGFPFNELDWPFGFDQHSGSMLPLEGYVRVTFRSNTASLNQAGSALTLDFWNSPSTLGSVGNILEVDINEIFGSGPPWANGYSIHPFGSCTFLLSGHGCQDSSFTSDWNNYHTLEGLITSDASTQLVICDILDGAFQLCKQFTSANPADLQYNGNTVSNNVGAICNNTTCPSSTNMDEYIQTYEYWSCANYKTSACPGTVITGP